MMERSRDRLVIGADELEAVARCPHALNFLDRIGHARACPACDAVAAAGRYLLKQVARDLRRPPTVGAVRREYRKARRSRHLDAAEEAREAAVVAALFDWSREVAERVNLVDVLAETHLGAWTVRGRIDAVLHGAGNDFSVVKFCCGRDHGEEVMNYEVLAARLWLREEYEADADSLLLVAPAGAAVRVQCFEQPIPASFLRASLIHILSGVGPGSPSDPDWPSELPPVYGEHCWSCNACFQQGARE